MSNDGDSSAYLERKRFFDSLLTIYGRKPVLEVLRDPDLPCYRLHLAKSNRQAGIVAEILALAEQRDIDVVYHTREALARISRNGKQDQGVAADLQCPGHQQLDDFLANRPTGNFSLIALDSITNPQNLGMIIRSVTASPSYGILLPEKGNAPLSPLVIKASAGTLFKSRIIRCGSLSAALKKLKNSGVMVCGLSSHSPVSLGSFKPDKPTVYVLGNETNGVSDQVQSSCDHMIRIEMENGVESLNVAVTAALIAFRSNL